MNEAITKLPYDTLKSFAPVSMLGRGTNVLVVNPALPVRTLPEFIALAKAKPKQLNYASTGVAGMHHFGGEMFKRAAGIDATHVPYKGAAPALNDLLGGQIQFMFDPGPGLQHAATGKLTLLAVASAKRASRYPDVPTLEELGMRVDADTTFGVYAPSGVSPGNARCGSA